MENDDLIHIQLSKIVHAEKWRVIRVLTKVWDLAKHVPTIEEVSIIKKDHNIIRTKWKILADEFPITWIEEDVLKVRENMIEFRAIEGDLEEFKGEWTFQDHPNGTEVVVNVYLSVGIPAIKDFADEHLKKLVTKNFESILEALELQLISKRYLSLKEGNPNKVAGFGLIGHFYNFNHLVRGLKMLKPDYKVPSKEFLGKLFNITPSFKMYEMPEYKSKSGDAVTNGCVILCTFIPDMIADNVESVYAKVVRACKLAEKSGVGIVTLGGFTSMVGERYGRKISEDVDIPITTGNTYTSALAIEGVEKAAQLLEKDLKDLKAVVVGGTGDIGSACARVLSEKAKHVTITGRTKSNLKALQRELKKIGKAKIEASTNNEKAVKDADIIIAAANTSASILKLESFKPGAIVCDLAYPKNIAYFSTRKDIFVFSGGLSTVPTPIPTGVMMGLPSPNVCYGCSCEAVILALERRFENFSFGRGNITVEKMREIKAIAMKHGFELAPFFWADKVITQEDIEEIKKNSRYG